MQSVHWSNLLKKLPPETHNQLAITTQGGTEVIVQAILELEGECLILKGRLAACQDTGRLYFVPYDQIDYIGFTRSVAEDEYRAWFGEPAVAPPANGSPEEPPAPSGGFGIRTPASNRAALLERVRVRTTTAGVPINPISLPTPPPAST